MTSEHRKLWQGVWDRPTETVVLAVGPCVPQAPGLPKTRSGKIMRRVLRKIAAKAEHELGDVSTLADPSVVEQLVALRGH
jgi:acetyl-CoA synthetase